MRRNVIGYAAGLALLAGFAQGAAQAQTPGQSFQLRVCPSQDKAEQLAQTRGNVMPDGCRDVAVTSYASLVGPMCLIDFGQDSSGIVGALTDAVATTAWWTPCQNLRAP